MSRNNMPPGWGQDTTINPWEKKEQNIPLSTEENGYNSIKENPIEPSETIVLKDENLTEETTVLNQTNNDVEITKSSSSTSVVNTYPKESKTLKVSTVILVLLLTLSLCGLAFFAFLYFADKGLGRFEFDFIPNQNHISDSLKEQDEEKETAKEDMKIDEDNEEERDDLSSIESFENYISGYILPYSDTIKLTEADLVHLSKEELSLARNEIYARHGRKFKTAKIQEYFDSQPWYEGSIEPDDFTQSLLNEIEIFNAEFIIKYESTRSDDNSYDSALQQVSLGIYAISIDIDVSQYYNIPMGVYVSNIDPNGSAAKANIPAGSIITKVANKVVYSTTDIQNVLLNYRKGDVIELNVEIPTLNKYVSRQILVTL